MKLTTLLTALLLACCTPLQAQYSTLNVWLKNGDIVKFAFSEHLRIVASSSQELTVESTGYSITYPVADLQKFTVNNDSLPAQLILSEGWNWISHNFSTSIPVETFDKAQQILSQTASAYNDDVLGMTGELKTLEATKGYKLNMTQGTVYTFTEATYATAAPTFALHQGWNWVGYPFSFSASLSAALSAAQWEEGDCIASQDAFAVYSDGAWQGSLNILLPQAAYLIKAASSKGLAYSTTTETKQRGLMHVSRASQKHLFICNKHAYPNTMNIIAQLKTEKAGAEDQSYTIAAFSGTECRGVGQMIDGRIYLTVHGTGGEPITFLAADAEGKHYAIAQTAAFTADLVGTPRSPYTLTLTDETTSIPQIAAVGTISEPLRIYALSGTLVKTAHSTADGNIDVALSDLPSGIYIIKSKSLNCKITKR